MPAALHVLHQLPGRCRLRLRPWPQTALDQARLDQRLRDSTLVASFNFIPACASLTIEYRGELGPLLASLVAPYPSTPAVLAEDLVVVPEVPSPGMRQPLQALAWSGAALLFGPMAGSSLTLLSLVMTGIPIWRRAASVIRHEQRLNVDFLDGLALAVAILRGHPRTGALMALMVHVGDVVREHTAGQARGQLGQLFDFQSIRARLVESNGIASSVTAMTLRCGQQVCVLAGELVPADGVVSNGRALLDQRHITGESAPAECAVGERVFAGAAVIDGSITLTVSAAAGNTTIARIVEQINRTPVGECRVQNYAEQFADKLVAPVLGVNLTLLAATANIDRFMSLAIVDFGTGIRIAAPASILSSMKRAAREGIVIKSGHHLEQLAGLRAIAFDKTGTLTHGRLAVKDIYVLRSRLPADSVLQLAAAAEVSLHHPMARALVSHACQVRGLVLPLATDVQYRLGLGVAADVAGHLVHVGSERYLQQLGIGIHGAIGYLRQLANSGQNALLVALDGALIGVIALSDTLRPEARSVVAGLHRRGVRDIIMLTGDRAAVAHRIAAAVGIDRVFADVLPHEKADIIRSLRRDDRPLAMVGDGVNDSPALARADVGIAMGGGADIARAAADVVLLADGLHQLLPAIDISRAGLALVRQNNTLIAGANTLALALALPAGLMSPVLCTLLSNGSALVAAANATRPLWPHR